MTNLLKIILSLSLSGTLLILVFFLFKPLWKDRLSKQWQYYIWLIIIIRLLLPLTPDISLVGRVFQQIEKNMLETERSISKTIDILPEQDIYSPNKTKGNVNTVLSENTDSLPKQYIFPLSMYIFFIWFIVALILLIRKITIYQDFVRYIKAGREPVDNIEILNYFGSLLSKTGIKGNIDLATNNLISSPLLMGTWHPCIVLPDIALSDVSFCYIIRHELIHYKRRDLLYKWLVQLTVCIHWFNPFVYLMRREINRACELSCDEAVIYDMNTEEKAAYGDTLLNAMEIRGNYKNSFASVTLSEGTELLKERLDSIMKFRKKSKLCRIVSIMLTAILGVGATVIGAYAMGTQASGLKTQVSQTEEAILSDGPKINIDIPQFNQSNQVIYGPYFLKAGTIWGTDLSWNGNGMVSVSCKKYNTDILSGEQLIQQENSPIINEFVIQEDGEYLFTITNRVVVLNANKFDTFITNLKGMIYIGEKPNIPSEESKTASDFPRLQFSVLENGVHAKAGPYTMLEGKSYTVSVKWEEAGSIFMVLTPKDNEKSVIANVKVENGIPFSITVPATGEYVCEFINTSGINITNFSCSISENLSNTQKPIYEVKQNDIFSINEPLNGKLFDTKFIIPEGITCIANLDWEGSGSLSLVHEEMDLSYDIEREQASFEMKEGTYRLVREDDSGKKDFPRNIVGTLTFVSSNLLDNNFSIIVSRGMIQIPVSIEKLDNNAIYVAEIPNLSNAVGYHYDIQAENGEGALYIGCQKTEKDVQKSPLWYNYYSANKQINITIMGDKSWIGFDENYSGNYTIYIGSKGTLSNITGLVTIYYNTN